MQILSAMFALAAAVASAPAFADEDADYGVAPVATLRLSDYSAPTSREVPGAKRLGTAQLREWLRGEMLPPPLLFDVLGGIETWLAASGMLAPLRLTWRTPAE